MNEIILALGAFITIGFTFKKFFWKDKPIVYSIYFTIGDKDILFLEKKHNKDQFEYECEQLVQIAKNPLKNIYLRMSNISYITIKHNLEELMRVKIV
jgi:hypothetical protein